MSENLSQVSGSALSSIETGPIATFRNNYLKSVLLTGVSALVAGCAVMHGGQAASVPKEYPPQKSCIEQPGLPLFEQQQRALDCIAGRTGKVALLNYDMSPADAEALAVKTEATIAKATDNIFRPDIVAVAPSDEAIRLFHSSNNKDGIDCAKTDEIAKDGAFIADALMDLHEYRVILSTTKLPDCDNAKGGVAYLEGARYASGFGVNPDDEDGHLKLAHEYMHTQGLDHASSALSVAMIRERVGKLPGETVSIDSYFEDNTYQEYGGDCNIMGYSNGYGGARPDVRSKELPNLELNPLQRRAIEWPERLLEYKKDGELHLGQQETLIDIAQETYGVISLEQPVRIRDNSSDQPEHFSDSFDQLALVPRKYCNLKVDPHVLNLFLKNSSGELIHTVSLYAAPIGIFDSGEHVVAIGNQTIKVKLDERGFVVSTISK